MSSTWISSVHLWFLSFSSNCFFTKSISSVFGLRVSTIVTTLFYHTTHSWKLSDSLAGVSSLKLTDLKCSSWQKYLTTTAKLQKYVYHLYHIPYVNHQFLVLSKTLQFCLTFRNSIGRYLFRNICLYKIQQTVFI